MYKLYRFKTLENRVKLTRLPKSTLENTSDQKCAPLSRSKKGTSAQL